MRSLIRFSLSAHYLSIKNKKKEFSITENLSFLNYYIVKLISLMLKIEIKIYKWLFFIVVEGFFFK